MDERIEGFLETIRDEAHVLLSGLPSGDKTTYDRLRKIEDAAMDAQDVLKNSVAGGKGGTAAGSQAFQESLGIGRIPVGRDSLLGFGDPNWPKGV